MPTSYKNRIVFLLGNILVFALRSLAIKAVSLVLMPSYTTTLAAGEYGTAGLLSSATEIVLPLLSAGVVEALYRFSIDDDVPKNELFASSLVVLGGGVVRTEAVRALGHVLWNMKHAGSSFILFCSAYLFKAITQLVRGLGHVCRFVAYGFTNILAMVVSTYLLLVRVHLGVKGYPWPFTIGYLVGGLVVFLGPDGYRLLTPFRLDHDLPRRMLVYSLPLAPNLLSWWPVSASGRYVVLWGSGVVAAGFFTAASKMPAPVSVVASVFQQAWQYSIVCEINSPDRGALLGVVMRGYSLATLTVAELIIALNWPISRVMLQVEFAEGWRYVPLLTLVASFGVISILSESFYQALKNSGAPMTSTALDAGVNVVLSVALVPFMRLRDADLARTMAYMLVLVVRARDLRRRINPPINRLRLTYQLALLTSITVCMFFDGGSWLTVVVRACLISLAISDTTVPINSTRAVTKSLRYRSGGLMRQL